MSTALLRLTVQAGDHRAVDLVLPAAPPLGALLPTIVDLAGAPHGAWHLTCLDGRRLDDSISLRANMIDDGDLLSLIPESVAPLPCRAPDAFELTATLAASPQGDPLVSRMTFCWAIVLSAVLICARGGSPIAAAVAALCCAFAIVAAGRTLPLLFSSIAIVLGAATGFLAVPSPPSAPNVLLAATAAALVSWIVMRLYPQNLTIGTTAVSFGMPIALTAGVATVHPLPLHALGAGLGAVAWTVLTLAPRSAVSIAGLTADTAEQPRVARTHQLLVGLVLGSAGAVVVGTGVMVVDHRHHAAILASGLLLAAALGLRSNVFARRILRRSVAGCGLVSATVTFAATAQAFPMHSSSLALVLLGGGPLMLRAGMPSTTANRVLARLDVVVSVLVLPIMLGITGAYAMVRGQ